MFKAPRHIRPPHHFLLIAKVAKQSLKIKQNFHKASHPAIALMIISPRYFGCHHTG
jgi:hypothetical protein